MDFEGVGNFAGVQQWNYQLIANYFGSSNYCSTISTRLLLALPCSVELLAIGDTGPAPYGLS